MEGETKKQLKKNIKNQGNKEIIGCPDFSNLYKIIADSITGGVWVAKKNNTICYANKGMSKIAGIPVKGFPGLNVLKDFPEDTLRFFKPYYLKAKKTGKKIKFEAVPVIIPNKQQTYQSGWLIPVIKNKKVEGIICTVDDVTEEENYKKELELSKETYQQFFEHLSSGVAVYNAIDNGKDFLLKNINKEGLKTTNKKREDVVGKKISKAYPGAREMGLIDILREVHKKGGAKYFSNKLYNDKNLTAWFDNHIYKLPTGEIVAVFNDRTEEEKIKNELEKSKKTYEQFFDNIPGGAVVYGAINNGKDFIIKDVNAAGERMNQVKRKNILGKRAEVAYPGIKKMGLFDILKKVYKTGKNEFYPIAFYKDKKVDKFFENYVYRLPSNDVVAVFWDKTEEVVIKRELEKNEEKFRSLYESSQDAIITLSPPNWNFISANRATVKMFKAKDEQSFTAKAPWNYSPKKQPDGRLSSVGVKEEIQKAMKIGSNNFKWVHKRLNGENFFTIVSLVKIKLENKELLQLIIRDVTKEVKQEEEIKERNELLNKVINSLPYPFCVIDANTHKIKEANRIAKEKMETLESAMCLETRHSRKSPCKSNHPCPLDIVKKTKKPVVIEHVHFNNKGNERLLEVHGYPIFNENNEVTEIIEYSMDVTEKNKKEEELKKHLADIEKINSLMINRELKMIELKEEIKKLKRN
jgi:PAS domain S-box-containing protein